MGRYDAWENPVSAAKLARGLMSADGLLGIAADISEKRGAMHLVKETKKGVDRQAPGGRVFKPLSQVTIDLKGSSKALIDKRDMYRGLRVTKEKRGYLAGVHRNVRSADGGRTASIARVHENGYDPAKDGGKGKVVIPARPFIGPTLAQESDRITDMVGGQASDLFFKGIGIR